MANSADGVLNININKNKSFNNNINSDNKHKHQHSNNNDTNTNSDGSTNQRAADHGRYTYMQPKEAVRQLLQPLKICFLAGPGG